MQKIVFYVFKLPFIILKDIFKTFYNLTRNDAYDIIEIIGFGLIINSIYGVYKLWNISDFILLICSIYGTLKIKHKKKEMKC